jgi:transcriptional regulator with XRE-family HTH domain
MSFGERLASERKRLGLRQAEFASLVGTDAAKQSLYENGKRELRADYLARLADAQVDVIYILTGQRAEGEWLAGGATDLLDAYFALPVEMQRALVDFAASLRAQFDRGPAPTVHARRTDFRNEPAERD